MGLPWSFRCPLLHYLCLTLVGLFRKTPSPLALRQFLIYLGVVWDSCLLPLLPLCHHLHFHFHPHLQLRVHLHFVGELQLVDPETLILLPPKRGPTQLAQLKINLAACLSVKCEANLEFCVWGSIPFGIGFSSPICKGIFRLIYMQRLRQITEQKQQI